MIGVGQVFHLSPEIEPDRLRVPNSFKLYLKIPLLHLHIGSDNAVKSSYVIYNFGILSFFWSNKVVYIIDIFSERPSFSIPE